jgi:acetyltransferase-like isoleucine patch superfamily enzyme
MVGDYVVFGQGVQISAHVVKPSQDGDLLCVVRPVHIGAGAFIGAGAVLGPGAVVDAGAMVAANSLVLGRRVRCVPSPP